MGYTHYWRRPKEITVEAMLHIAEDFGRLVLPLADNGISLAGPLGNGEPIITTEAIAFNGNENCGHPSNSEISIPWPSSDAGGIGSSLTGVDGRWFAGASLEHRCCDGDCSYETFRIPRLMEVSDWQTPENGLYFECCKTAFRPYDIAVTACLIIAKRWLGDAVKVTSDGEDQHWFDAKMLCQSVLGYGLEFALSDELVNTDISRTQPLATAAVLEPPKPPTPKRPVRDVSLTDTAKLIRQELRARWPETKFSVRSKSYSGGCSIDVSWTDGPTGKEVQPVLDGFRGADFDGMQDLKTYRDASEVNGELVRYHADYVFGHRSLSRERLLEVADRVCYEIGAPMVEVNEGGGIVYGGAGGMVINKAFHLPYDVTGQSLDQNVDQIAGCDWKPTTLAQLIIDIAYATSFTVQAVAA